MFKIDALKSFVRANAHFAIQATFTKRYMRCSSVKQQLHDFKVQGKGEISSLKAQLSYEAAVALPTPEVIDEAVSLMPPRPKRIVMGITGATGAIYAIRMLEMMRRLNIETHLVISKWAMATLKYETDLSESHIRSLATASYTAKDLSAPIASGSFQHDGMVIVPCSMKTLAAIRIGFCDDLISRAGDVSLKEGRKLLLVVRETPLSDIHLDNMLTLRRAGATIFPPVPAFYTQPKDLDDLVNQSVGRMFDALGIFVDSFHRWNGFERQKKA
ncbi:hypothetical protein PV08_05931 [Exophiala spinifera]|uniref:Flavin prenyltransferase PAD1, mitochondrial n=1 Tax=Exophiala spinifera TaxID=91928 RepID=A0A0D1YLH2_9EURO|nr:uncharacterized protein PV08_05931 [Exophiala spinifera]KIW15881.1 hypothetical protein PV08_05931 [Exophiala spinifera]